MIPSIVTVAGWTGDEAGPNGPNGDALRTALWKQLDAEQPHIAAQFAANDPDAKRTVREVGMDQMYGFFVAHAHRAAAPAAQRLERLAVQCLNAVTTADEEYASLSHNTTVNWLAAHHRFVLATKRARDLLEQRVQAAEELLKHRGFLAEGDNDFGFIIYCRFVPAEHRITMPDLEQLKTQLANFVQTSTERFRVTRVTITGGYPEGFAPAPLDTTQIQPADDDEIAWRSETYPASTAVVSGARNW